MGSVLFFFMAAPALMAGLLAMALAATFITGMAVSVMAGAGAAAGVAVMGILPSLCTSARYRQHDPAWDIKMDIDMQKKISSHPLLIFFLDLFFCVHKRIIKLTIHFPSDGLFPNCNKIGIDTWLCKQFFTSS